MPNFRLTIKAYLKKVGRPAVLIRSDGGEEHFFAVIEQTWKRNKTNFENKSSKLGQVYNEYCVVICPYDVDLTQTGKGDIFEIENERYIICRSERIYSLGQVQFYRGILKKVREADENVFC